MNDAPIFIGWTGTFATVSLGPLNEIIAIICGLTTTVYMALKLKEQLKKKK